MKRASKSAKLTVLDSNVPISAETEAIENRIRQRAFERSQTRPPDAHELYDWIMAESEVISVPAAEVVEKNGQFEVKFAIAGVNPDDVSIVVTPDQIMLKSEYQQERNAVEGTVHLSDFRSATIFRSIQLPGRIDVNGVKATYDEGLLRVMAPKEGAQPPPAKRPAATRKAPAKKSRSKLP